MTKPTESYLVFTPRNREGTERYTWHITADDMQKRRRGSSWSATITNQLNGKSYKVRGASCGLPRCMCDAVVVKEVQRGA